MSATESGTPVAHRFQATRWSLVARATAEDTPEARAALDELCRLYWPPLHAFARRWGLGEQDAEDATQMFFAELLRTGRLALADPERGRLRTFLLSTFTKRLHDFRRRQHTEGRGGAHTIISLDAPLADSGLRPEAADPHTPEREFTRQWAMATLGAAMAALEKEYRAPENARVLAACRPLLGLGASGNEDYALVAQQLGMKEGAARVLVCRVRKKFREALFRAVAETLEEPTEANIRAEIGALIEALSD
jgi:RNA polymerase sigma-70 factor (ECF subfamily)